MQTFFTILKIILATPMVLVSTTLAVFISVPIMIYKMTKGTVEDVLRSFYLD